MMDREQASTTSVAASMTRQVVPMRHDIRLADARAISREHEFNGFPVVTPEGRLVGIVTKGDLLRAVEAGFRDPAVWEQPVVRWMARGVLALRPQDSLETAVSLMVSNNFRSLPVIDAQDRLVGIVSRGDLMRALDGPGASGAARGEG